MKILVVGGGGREHAIIKKLKESPAVTEIFALPGNGGISADATCVPIGATDLDGIVQFVKEHPVDYAVVTPDDPLVLGCVDRLNEIGVPCFGPKQNAAVIEGSKAFAKDLMKKYHIPTARYETFSDLQAALDYVQAQPLPLVVKADGLALGKGVLICQTREEAVNAVTDMMANAKSPSCATASMSPRSTPPRRKFPRSSGSWSAVRSMRSRKQNPCARPTRPSCLRPSI